MAKLSCEKTTGRNYNKICSLTARIQQAQYSTQSREQQKKNPPAVNEKLGNQ